MKNYFYKKEKKQIVPVDNTDTNKAAKELLDKIYEDNSENIPKRYSEKWDEVGLYSPSGELDKANAIILEVEDGAYSLKNKLNDLTGKEWTKFTCSWFIYNALKTDLHEEKKLNLSTEDHPATYGPTMIEQFIKFFTKEGEMVFDPFLGIGSTLVAARRTNRFGSGVELNKKYFDICQERLPEFGDKIFNGDSLELSKFEIPNIDFSISSPPYWDILNRSTHKFAKDRKDKNLDISYSDEINDLGNIENYDEFIQKLSKVYLEIYEKLRIGGYLVVIIKNIKKEGKMYPLAWDLARELSKTYTLKDEKLWIQDKVGLAPYGYPYSWASNILHHYCLVFQK
jgi:hypothetical protein